MRERRERKNLLIKNLVKCWDYTAVWFRLMKYNYETFQVDPECGWGGVGAHEEISRYDVAPCLNVHHKFPME
jgi:hypothetical protein